MFFNRHDRHVILIMGDDGTKKLYGKVLIDVQGMDATASSKVVSEVITPWLDALVERGMVVPPIVHVDNGSEFKRHFRAVLEEEFDVGRGNGRLRLRKARVPQGGGFIERAIQIVQKQLNTSFGHLPDKTTPQEYAARLDSSLDTINTNPRRLLSWFQRYMDSPLSYIC